MRFGWYLCYFCSHVSALHRPSRHCGRFKTVTWAHAARGSYISLSDLPSTMISRLCNLRHVLRAHSVAMQQNCQRCCACTASSWLLVQPLSLGRCHNAFSHNKTLSKQLTVRVWAACARTCRCVVTPKDPVTGVGQDEALKAINTGDTAWMLISAAIVMIMTPGEAHTACISTWNARCIYGGVEAAPLLPGWSPCIEQLQQLLHPV